jgi:hypothetical protein
MTKVTFVSIGDVSCGFPETTDEYGFTGCPFDYLVAQRLLILYPSGFRYRCSLTKKIRENEFMWEVSIDHNPRVSEEALISSIKKAARILGIATQWGFATATATTTTA